MHTLHSFSSSTGPLVLKLGGAALAAGSPPTPSGASVMSTPGASAGSSLLAEVAELVRSGQRAVLIHGGGPEIDRELAERQIPTVRVDGLRVTDAKTLAVTESVLCATVNKAIVRALTALNIPAVGISGQDGRLLICERENNLAQGERESNVAQGERSEAPCHPEQSAAGASSRDRGSLGFVGTVTHVNPAVINALLDAGFVPVIAPLGIAADGSTAYNVNGDTAAGAIAAALHAQIFILVTNVERVRRDPDDATSGIATMTLAQARTFLASDACRQSMKPKIAAAITAVESGATAHICAESPTTIADALSGTGTTIAA